MTVPPLVGCCHWNQSGKTMQLLYILPFGILSAISDVCENSIGSVYVGGYCDLSESGLLCLT